MPEKKHTIEVEEIEEKTMLARLCGCCTHMWVGAAIAVLVIAGSIFYNGHVLGKKLDTLHKTVSKMQVAAAPSAVPQAAGAPAVPTGPVDVAERSDAPVIGNKNAEVVMYEFSDFQCPYCARFYKETLPQIKSEYVDTGKVKIVYRHFPLAFHPYAQKTAEAGECAARQGKFEAMHNSMFENSTSDGINLSVDKLKGYANKIGLNTSKFNSCLDNGDTASVVSKDMADGSAAGVTGTPTFFINGRMLVGAMPFATFKQIIDEELDK